MCLFNTSNAMFSDPELEIKRNHSSFGILQMFKKERKKKKNNRKNKTEKKNIYI